MIRLVSMAVFVTLAAAAGVLYFEQTKQATVVVATHDLVVGSQIQDQDVMPRSVSAASSPVDALTGPADAVGQYVAFPVLAGQFLLHRQVSSLPNASQLTHGLAVPPASRVISLPVTPASAVGGSLRPGDLVDVLAISAVDHSGPALDIASPPMLLGQRIPVVGLRTEQGTALDPPARPLGNDEKIGSVLVAIPATDEARYAAAMPGSTFVLMLVTD
jgi:Flp pilus assembly protein CpaB